MKNYFLSTDAAVEKNRPTFKSAGTAKHISPRTHYTREAQVLRFTRLLGSKSKAEQLITATSYLARGHLVPDGDGIYRTWQYATYFYINVVPMWQVKSFFQEYSECEPSLLF
jgi:hypothetical protein